jgi:hypothetical protein
LGGAFVVVVAHQETGDIGNSRFSCTTWKSRMGRVTRRGTRGAYTVRAGFILLLSLLLLRNQIRKIITISDLDQFTTTSIDGIRKIGKCAEICQEKQIYNPTILFELFVCCQLGLGYRDCYLAPIQPYYSLIVWWFWWPAFCHVLEELIFVPGS